MPSFSCTVESPQLLQQLRLSNSVSSICPKTLTQNPNHCEGRTKGGSIFSMVKWEAAISPIPNILKVVNVKMFVSDAARRVSGQVD